LAGIREVDAIVYVLRAFEDEDVPGSSNPLDHLAVVEIELALADLGTLESQLEKKKRATKLDKTAGLADEVAAMEAAYSFLSQGTPLYRSTIKDDHRELLKPLFLLTNKPVLALVNVGDGDLDVAEQKAEPVRAAFDGKAEVIPMCVQLEAEAAELVGDERREMLEALGLGEGGLARFVHAAYHLLGLRTFFTTGEDESRAWTFRAGSKAPECAGKIHGDLQRGFIRAEVVHWDELLEAGSWSKAREAGKLRVEGKDYEVVDGDVMVLTTYDGVVLSPLQVADSFFKRFRGAMMRSSLDHAILLPHTRSVHTGFMRINIDVAFVEHRSDDTLVVRLVKHDVAPWRGLKATRPSNAVLEAQAGAFEAWGIIPGLVLRVKPDSTRDIDD
jgi:hypothetical protein